ncbi:hypothetical protein RYX36_004832 [Vicia faba]
MGADEVKFMIEKELTNNDVTQTNGRLSIPKEKIKEGFLTPTEESYLDYEQNEKDDGCG